MKYIQIYKEDRPTKIIDSKRYGVIAYYDWLCRERDRINQSPGRRAHVKGNPVKKHNASCCLMVNKLFGKVIR